MKKIPMWLKTFGVLYLTMATMNTFTTTMFIGELISIILGLWIAGWCVYKVFGGMFTVPSVPLPMRRTESFTDEQNRTNVERRAVEKNQRTNEEFQAKVAAEHAIQQEKIYG